VQKVKLATARLCGICVSHSLQNAVMLVKIANKINIWCKSGLIEHMPCIGAYRRNFASLNQMMAIQWQTRVQFLIIPL